MSAPPLTLREALRPADRTWVRQVLDATGFFRPEEVEIAVELVDDALARGSAASGYHFLFAEIDGAPVGYSCFGPVPLTASSWDLYWIAVDPARQGEGLGRRLLRASEETVRAAGGRQVFVDTSGRPSYLPTRSFYERCGYEIAAELADFYAPGDGKVIYRRTLAG